MDNRPSGGGCSAIGSGGGGGNRSNNPPRTRKSKNKRTRRKNDNTRRNAGGGGCSAGKGGGGGGNNNKRSKGPPSPPQTKIIIRNIGDVNKHGSVKDVIELIRSIINGANQKLAATASRVVQLDEASVECLIAEEEAILKAQAEEAAKKKAARDKNNAGDNENGADKAELQRESMPIKPRSKSEGSAQDNTSVSLSTTEASTTNLGARLVYIVPPKQTRRRGIKPGCAYLVISGPAIEPKDPSTSTTTAPPDSAKEEKKDTAESGDANKPTDTSSRGENHVVIVDPNTATFGSNNNAFSSTADYSREVAKGRFLVFQAIEVMETHAKEDVKAEQKYAGSMVEVALSGKTYKHQTHRRDRREGTLETTADFNFFIESAAKTKEERMARPKPTPGGGVTTATTPALTTSDTLENGQPIAVLVEHIRSKRAEASKRKKAKKKAKESSNKEKGNGAGNKSSRKKKGKDGSKEEGGKKGGRKKERVRKRPGKKKNGTGGGSNSMTSATAPTTVLKPGTLAAQTGLVASPQPQPAAASLPGINGAVGGFQGFG